MDDAHMPHRQLNALLDGELTPAEAERLTRTLDHNPVLRQRLDDLRRVRHLTRQALESDSVAEHRPRRRFSARTGAVAGALLALGFIAGWYTGENRSVLPQPLQRASGGDTAAQSTTEEMRIVLHLASAHPAKMKLALDKAEGMLDSYARAGRQLRLELIANGGGIDLLRADISPERQRINELQQRYVNVTFLACRKTLEQLKRQTGTTAPLLPQVIIVPSALDQIVDRLQSGWNYVQA